MVLTAASNSFQIQQGKGQLDTQRALPEHDEKPLTCWGTTWDASISWHKQCQSGSKYSPMAMSHSWLQVKAGSTRGGSGTAYLRLPHTTLKLSTSVHNLRFFNIITQHMEISKDCHCIFTAIKPSVTFHTVGSDSSSTKTTPPQRLPGELQLGAPSPLTQRLEAKAQEEKT